MTLKKTTKFKFSLLLRNRLNVIIHGIASSSLSNKVNKINHGDIVCVKNNENIKICIVACDAELWEGPLWAFFIEVVIISSIEHGIFLKKIHLNKPAISILKFY